MKTFRVLRHPELGYKAVKVGFSWPGFLFSVIWLLMKKLWVHSVVIMTSIAVLTFMEVFFNNAQTSVMVLFVEFGVYFLVGVNCNDWLASNLQERGFKLMETLQAETADAAIGKTAGK